MTRLLRWTLALALFAGCAANGLQSLDASSDAAVPTDRSLTFVSSDALQLEPGAHVSIAVGLRDERTGEPLPGEDVHFALVRGDARDATLSDTVATTGSGADLGIARTTLLASSGAAAFWIRASASRASDVYLFVGVSARGFGSIAMTTTYTGARHPQALTVDVFDVQDCAHIATMEPVRSADIPASGGIATFGSLPAGVSFAVRGTATGLGGVTLATGCIDRVTFAHDETVHRATPFSDLPLQPVGTYDATFRLDLGATPLVVEAAWTSALNREIARHGTEPDYVLDAVANAIGMAHNPARDAFDAVRPMLHSGIATLYSTRGASPLQSLLRLASDTAASAQTVTVRATASARAGTSNPTAIDLNTGAITVDPLTPDVMSDDVSTPLTVSGTGQLSVSSDDRASGAVHHLSLPFPIVAHAAESALLGRLGAGSTAEWARLSARCADVVMLLTPATGSTCGADCVATACNGAVNQLAAVLDASMTAEGASHTTASLLFEGTVTGVPGTVSIQQMSMGALAGAFDDDPTMVILGSVQLVAQSPR